MSSTSLPVEMLPLLKKVSRSFYLSIRFLPKPMRGAVAIAYLLARASDTVADSSDEEPELRISLLRQMRGEMNGGSAQDKGLAGELLKVSQAVDHAGEVELLGQWISLLDWMRSLPEGEQACVRRVIHTIVTGQIDDVERFELNAEMGRITSLPDRDALNTYTYSVAGCVGRFWTEIAVETLGARVVGRSVDEQIGIGERFGQGLQLINILRDMPKDRALGRCYLPEDWQRESGVSIVDLPADLWRKADVWRNLCGEWVAAGQSYASGMRGIRLRFTAMLPAMLASETLAKLDGVAWSDLENGVKVTRREVRGQMFKALWFAIFGRRG